MVLHEHANTYVSKPRQERPVWAVAGFVLLAAVLMSEPAWAAAGDEFQDLYLMVRGWCVGSLGKTIAMAFLLVGMGTGVVRGSVLAAVSCISAGVALLMLPSIVDTMFAAAG